MNLNQVMLAGNLTRDPELRYIASNTAVCGFGIAINRKWKDASGQAKEETTFVDCEAWAKTAEVINQYMKKGSSIFVMGRLRLEQWDDKESGAKRSKMKVVVESFQFTGGKQDGQDRQERPAKPAASKGGGGRSGQHAPASQGDHAAIPEEDIPFMSDGVCGPVWRS